MSSDSRINRISPEQNRIGLERAWATRRRMARDSYADLLPEIQRLRNEDGVSFGGIASRLNDSGRTTRNGAAFKPTTVLRILARATADQA